MKYRVRKKRMNQKSGHNSYSKTRHLFKRLRMGHTHKWLMANDLKYYIRLANFPTTANDTLWTAYLRLKRVHRRQTKYKVVRDVRMEMCVKSLMRAIKEG